MKLLAVDDEKLLLEDFIPQLLTQPNVESAVGFNCPTAALEYIKNNDIDAAFIDIVMPEMSGLDLAKEIKLLRPNVEIIFLTAHAKYSVDAFKTRASGYILKPPQDEEIQEELNFIATKLVKTSQNAIFAQTFGNFEIFAEGKPVKFGRSKSKEILAYLIDRQGASVTKKELSAIIWEDKEYTRTKQIQLETLIRELISSLKMVGAGGIISRTRNSICVDKSQFDCDFYNFCNHESTAIRAYKGEYMKNYSWAEPTVGYLDSNSIK